MQDTRREKNVVSAGVNLDGLRFRVILLLCDTCSLHLFFLLDDSKGIEGERIKDNMV